MTEIERALLDGEIDLAVHSAKDLPTDLPDGLAIAGCPGPRGPARRLRRGRRLDRRDPAEGARVGTSSLRRRAQLLAARPDLEVVEMRGNVDTRLRKLADGGLRRHRPRRGGPAPARARRRGRVRLRGRRADPGRRARAPSRSRREPITRRQSRAAQTITDREALGRLGCERAAVSALGANCDTPVGATAWIESDRMLVSGFCGLPDGSEWIRDTAEGDASDPEAIGRAARRADEGRRRRPTCWSAPPRWPRRWGWRNERAGRASSTSSAPARGTPA